MATATLTDAGKNLVRDTLRGITDARILYVAIGTNNTAPSGADVALGTETFRKALTSSANGAGVGEALFTLYLSPQDAIGTAIKEVGWFAGASASATPGSGILLARALYTHTKTANESIAVVFDYDIT